MEAEICFYGLSDVSFGWYHASPLLVPQQLGMLSFRLMFTGSQKFKNCKNTGWTSRMTWREDHKKKLGWTW